MAANNNHDINEVARFQTQGTTSGPQQYFSILHSTTQQFGQLKFRGCDHKGLSRERDWKRGEEKEKEIAKAESQGIPSAPGWLNASLGSEIFNFTVSCPVSPCHVISWCPILLSWLSTSGRVQAWVWSEFLPRRWDWSFIKWLWFLFFFWFWCIILIFYLDNFRWDWPCTKSTCGCPCKGELVIFFCHQWGISLTFMFAGEKQKGDFLGPFSELLAKVDFLLPTNDIHRYFRFSVTEQLY